jgi:hypothetical protein
MIALTLIPIVLIIVGIISKSKRTKANDKVNGEVKVIYHK